jgi:hypothetical protein
MGQASRAPELRPPAAAAQQGPRWCVWPDYSSRRSNIATSMAGSITTCSITSSLPMSLAIVPTVDSAVPLEAALVHPEERVQIGAIRGWGRATIRFRLTMC